MRNNYNNLKTLLINAGELLKSKFNGSFNYSVKSKFDLVSNIDNEIENYIITELKKYDSTISIFSEEIGTIDNNSDYKWIIDPLDGTANFIFGVPYFNISVALEYKNEIIEGYVYNPINNEFYFSDNEKKKSFLNENEIKVSDTNKINETLVVFGFSANYNNIKKYYEKWNILFKNCKKGIGLLSPALNICNVARGRIDCFLDFGSNMEGHAAGSLILKNAGGKILNYDFTNWDHKTKGIIATNGKIDMKIIEKV